MVFTDESDKYPEWPSNSKKSIRGQSSFKLSKDNKDLIKSSIPVTSKQLQAKASSPKRQDITTPERTKRSQALAKVNAMLNNTNELKTFSSQPSISVTYESDLQSSVGLPEQSALSNNLKSILNKAEHLLEQIKSSNKSMPISNESSRVIQVIPTRATTLGQDSQHDSINYLLNGIPDLYDVDDPIMDNEQINELIQQDFPNKPPSQLQFPSIYASNQRLMSKLVDCDVLNISLSHMVIYNAKYGIRRDSSYFLLRLPSSGVISSNSNPLIHMIQLPELKQSNIMYNPSNNSKISLNNEYFSGNLELYKNFSFPIRISDKVVQDWTLNKSSEQSCIRLELYSFLYPPLTNIPTSSSSETRYQSKSYNDKVNNPDKSKKRAKTLVQEPVLFGYVDIPLSGLFGTENLDAIVTCQLTVDDNTFNTVSNRLASLPYASILSRQLHSQKFDHLTSKMGSVTLRITLESSSKSNSNNVSKPSDESKPAVRRNIANPMDEAQVSTKHKTTNKRDVSDTAVTVNQLNEIPAISQSELLNQLYKQSLPDKVEEAMNFVPSEPKFTFNRLNIDSTLHTPPSQSPDRQSKNPFIDFNIRTQHEGCEPSDSRIDMLLGIGIHSAVFNNDQIRLHVINSLKKSLPTSIDSPNEIYFLVRYKDYSKKVHEDIIGNLSFTNLLNYDSDILSFDCCISKVLSFHSAKEVSTPIDNSISRRVIFTPIFEIWYGFNSHSSDVKRHLLGIAKVIESHNFNELIQVEIQDVKSRTNIFGKLACSLHLHHHNENIVRDMCRIQAISKRTPVNKVLQFISHEKSSINNIHDRLLNSNTNQIIVAEPKQISVTDKSFDEKNILNDSNVTSCSQSIIDIVNQFISDDMTVSNEIPETSNCKNPSVETGIDIDNENRVDEGENIVDENTKDNLQNSSDNHIIDNVDIDTDVKFPKYDDVEDLYNSEDSVKVVTTTVKTNFKYHTLQIQLESICLEENVLNSDINDVVVDQSVMLSQLRDVFGMGFELYYSIQKVTSSVWNGTNNTETTNPSTSLIATLNELQRSHPSRMEWNTQISDVNHDTTNRKWYSIWWDGECSVFNSRHSHTLELDHSFNHLEGINRFEDYKLKVLALDSQVLGSNDSGEEFELVFFVTSQLKVDRSIGVNRVDVVLGRIEVPRLVLASMLTSAGCHQSLSLPIQYFDEPIVVDNFPSALSRAPLIQSTEIELKKMKDLIPSLKQSLSISISHSIEPPLAKSLESIQLPLLNEITKEDQYQVNDMRDENPLSDPNTVYEVIRIDESSNKNRISLNESPIFPFPLKSSIFNEMVTESNDVNSNLFELSLSIEEIFHLNMKSILPHVESKISTDVLLFFTSDFRNSSSINPQHSQRINNNYQHVYLVNKTIGRKLSCFENDVDSESFHVSSWDQTVNIKLESPELRNIVADNEVSSIFDINSKINSSMRGASLLLSLYVRDVSDVIAPFWSSFQPLYSSQKSIQHDAFDNSLSATHGFQMENISSVTGSAVTVDSVRNSDVLVGQVVVDLSMLAYGVSEINGWYHIYASHSVAFAAFPSLNENELSKGQVKIKVCIKDNLNQDEVDKKDAGQFTSIDDNQVGNQSVEVDDVVEVNNVDFNLTYDETVSCRLRDMLESLEISRQNMLNRFNMETVHNSTLESNALSDNSQEVYVSEFDNENHENENHEIVHKDLNEADNSSHIIDNDTKTSMALVSRDLDTTPPNDSSFGADLSSMKLDVSEGSEVTYSKASIHSTLPISVDSTETYEDFVLEEYAAEDEKGISLLNDIDKSSVIYDDINDDTKSLDAQNTPIDFDVAHNEYYSDISTQQLEYTRDIPTQQLSVATGLSPAKLRQTFLTSIDDDADDVGDVAHNVNKYVDLDDIRVDKDWVNNGQEYSNSIDNDFTASQYEDNNNYYDHEASVDEGMANNDEVYVNNDSYDDNGADDVNNQYNTEVFQGYASNADVANDEIDYDMYLNIDLNSVQVIDVADSVEIEYNAEGYNDNTNDSIHVENEYHDSFNDEFAEVNKDNTIGTCRNEGAKTTVSESTINQSNSSTSDVIELLNNEKAFDIPILFTVTESINVNNDNDIVDQSKFLGKPITEFELPPTSAASLTNSKEGGDIHVILDSMHEKLSNFNFETSNKDVGSNSLYKIIPSTEEGSLKYSPHQINHRQQQKNFDTANIVLNEVTPSAKVAVKRPSRISDLIPKTIQPKVLKLRQEAASRQLQHLQLSQDNAFIEERNHVFYRKQFLDQETQRISKIMMSKLY